MSESLSTEQVKSLLEYIEKSINGGQLVSYRYLIYNILKFKHGEYGDGIYMGLLDFNNLLHELKNDKVS